MLSANLHRRHLSPGQQAAIVASAQDCAKAQTRGGTGANQHVQSKSRAPDLSSIEQRATTAGVSRTTQQQADVVAKASPEIAVKVGHGEVTLPDAVAQVTGKPTSPATCWSPRCEPHWKKFQ